jgi:hypothetical protein
MLGCRCDLFDRKLLLPYGKRLNGAQGNPHPANGFDVADRCSRYWQPGRCYSTLSAVGFSESRCLVTREDSKFSSGGRAATSVWASRRREARQCLGSVDGGAPRLAKRPGKVRGWVKRRTAVVYLRNARSVRSTFAWTLASPADWALSSSESSASLASSNAWAAFSDWHRAARTVWVMRTQSLQVAVADSPGCPRFRSRRLFFDSAVSVTQVGCMCMNSAI